MPTDVDLTDVLLFALGAVLFTFTLRVAYTEFVKHRSFVDVGYYAYIQKKFYRYAIHKWFYLFLFYSMYATLRELDPFFKQWIFFVYLAVFITWIHMIIDDIMGRRPPKR